MVGQRSINRPEAAAFVAGAVGMGLEILAGRMVAPQFGSSIYTWGSVIGVFLAGLGYGYHRGGRRAGAHASERRLARVFLAAAAYVAVLTFVGDVLLRSTTAVPLPSRFAALPAVAILFGPPTYLLGYVSPYAAELSGTDGVGEASGRVYALGTAGSIFGVFGTTFGLVPWLGVEAIGLAIGAVAMATAAALIVPFTDRGSVAALAVVVVLLGAAAGGSAAGVSADGRLVYETQTTYQELRVVDSDGIRTLYLDGQRHSAMDIDRPNHHVFTYTRYFHLPMLMTEDVDRVLFVGGGGFTGPRRFLEEYDATVDVVELDPAVVETARRHFRLPASDRLNVHVGDGRAFLRETNHTYDLIVLDAYRRDKVPFHLTTVEFMELAKDRLDDDGVLLANLIAAPRGPASRFYRSEYRTIQRVFPEVYTFTTVDGPVVQNVEVVATRNETRLTSATLHARNERRDVGVDLETEIDHYRRPPRTDDVPVLRDDRSPVSRLMDPMLGQEYVVQETNGTISTARAASTVTAG